METHYLGTTCPFSIKGKDEQKMLVLLEIKEKQIKYRTWLFRSKL